MASTTLPLVCISLQMPRVCPFTISAFSGSRSAPKLKVVLGGGADKCPPYQIHFQTNFSPKKLSRVQNANMVLNALVERIAVKCFHVQTMLIISVPTSLDVLVLMMSRFHMMMQWYVS